MVNVIASVRMLEKLPLQNMYVESFISYVYMES